MKRSIRIGVLVAFALLASTAAVQADDSPPEASERTPMAVVDDEVWYVEDVEGAVGFRIFQHRMDIHSLLLGEAERRIDERLLAAEAVRRGTTVEAMLEAVMSGGKDEPEDVSDEDVDRYLAEHQAAGQEKTEQARNRIRHYLGESRRIERRIAFLESLRERAGVKILLEQPRPPRTDLDFGSAPVRGPDEADVTLVHFAGLGSRSSARSSERIAKLVEKYPGRIRWVHVHFFNGRDERSLAAARLSFLADDGGRFWDYHDAVLALNGKASLEALKEIARKLEVSTERIGRAQDDAVLLRRVKADLDLGNRVGVQREPSLFLNGRFVSGLISDDELEAILVEELAR